MYAIDYEDFGTPQPVNGQAGAGTAVAVEIDGRAVTVPECACRSSVQPTR
jgi:hypothetical protein